MPSNSACECLGGKTASSMLCREGAQKIISDPAGREPPVAGLQ